MRAKSAPLLLGLLATFLFGCAPRPQPGALPAPGRPPRADRARSGAPPAPETAIRSDGAGPIRLGAPASEVERLPGHTVLRFERRVEGERIPALSITRFGMPVAMVELKDGRVWRITVFAEGFRTAEGARVGMTAAELERIYGPGTVLTGEGAVCARFERAPGLSFCFAPDRRLPARPRWSDLRTRGARVHRILVVGAG